uniref:NBR1 autophagy cargo receptor a n=1 Tax=Tetraodon nigroviridis TaxID=99883 RepID=H3DA87_TETNG
MGLPVTIKVNFRGNVKRFLAQDLDKLEWESVEAWIKASFGINHFQVKYFDEDNEEICINSQDEYEEAIKSAEKQGNQLHMNVYKMKGQACGGPLKTEVKELKGDLRPAPPYPSRVKTVDKGTQVTPEREAVSSRPRLVAVKDARGGKPEDEPPPMWFRSYMEKFKDEVVKEVVERMCSDFSGQCCTHKSPEGNGEASGAAGGVLGPLPGPSASNGSLGYTPNCSSCHKLTSDGAYKCSVCPSCILCETCRHSHDPSHSLVRTKTPLSIPEHGMSGEEAGLCSADRFARRGDRTVRKAERQRLKAERRQLRAEVKEIKKKLRLEKRGLQWSGPSTSGSGPAPLYRLRQSLRSKPGPFSTMLCTLETRGPGVWHGSLVPTMAALFLDENLPDGTRLEPGTKFIKYWKMRNSGTVSWTSETKLTFMWGNLGRACEDRREVPVPLLLPGQVGVVSVAFVAPGLEGTYTSHWRLAHCGCQFGPRVWCSIVVERAPEQTTGKSATPSLLNTSTLHFCWSCFICPAVLRPQQKEEAGSLVKEKVSILDLSVDLNQDDLCFPSVELLTAQDLLSFELLDINIVQELEKVPTNTPVDVTPCMSPLPHNPAWSSPLRDQADVPGAPSLFGLKLGQQKEPQEPALLPEEEREEEMSGAQFLCETVMRSLTLEEAPDHRPPRRAQPRCSRQGDERPPPLPEPAGFHGDALTPSMFVSHLPVAPTAAAQEGNQEKPESSAPREEEVSSQASSVSSCDDYIILPDCFDTSRPLGESAHHRGGERLDPSGGAESSWPPPGPQTLDPVTLAPEAPPPSPLPPPPALYSPRSEALYLAEDPRPPACDPYDPRPPRVHLNGMFLMRDSSFLTSISGQQSGLPAGRGAETRQRNLNFLLCCVCKHARGQGGITEGLVKGALSVAASAYKALFTGPNCSVQRGIDPGARQDPSMMAMLLEMGFRDQRLNQQLLKKHSYSLLHTVNELVQMAEDSWGQRRP